MNSNYLGGHSSEFRDESEQWEPKSPDEWMRQDPFRMTELSIAPRQQEFGYPTLFATWRRLPSFWRRQVWREREIAAKLYVLSRNWDNIPGIRSIGVGKREVGSRRSLVGIVSIESEKERETPYFHERYDIPNSTHISSAIPDLRAVEGGEEIPIIIEYVAPHHLFSYGIVPPDQFINASDTLPLPIATPTLRGGDVIYGESPVGFRKPGTLTAVVSHEQDETPLILSAAHVLGDVGWNVLADVPNTVKVGKVIRCDKNLDAAIAELDKPWIVDYRLKEMNVIPAAPVMPFADMPVQFVGGKSGHIEGWIDVANSIPMGGKSLNIIPHFRASIASQEGDSGALVISSHGFTPPFSSTYASRMQTAYLEAMTCAMLGMLVAGPSKTPSATTRPQTYITPILNILADFELQAWARSP